MSAMSMLECHQHSGRAPSAGPNSLLWAGQRSESTLDTVVATRAMGPRDLTRLPANSAFHCQC